MKSSAAQSAAPRARTSRSSSSLLLISAAAIVVATNAISLRREPSHGQAKASFLATNGRGLLRSATNAPNYDEFLPACVDHLRAMLQALRQSHTHSHLNFTLASECRRYGNGGFRNLTTCLNFTADLVEAREEELSSGNISGYVSLCKSFWESRSGFKAPNVTYTLTTTAKPEADDQDNEGSPDVPENKKKETALEKFPIGEKKCQCIGINGFKGETFVEISGKSISYPGDLGGHCDTWDKALHPSCMGDSPEDWCSQKWCYVDPCECDIDVIPKKSNYMPDASFQGKPLYYSYATCRSFNTFSKGSKKDLAEAKNTCEAKKDPYVVGFEQCRCIGIAGQSGTTKVDGMMILPAEVGATCGAWDRNTHPDCKGNGDDMPAWCLQKWCYVDPCECNLPEDTPPKMSTYLPGASYQNRPLYYSYATCSPGAADHFTAERNPDACFNKASEKECEASEKCAWKSGHCLGKELQGMC